MGIVDTWINISIIFKINGKVINMDIFGIIDWIVNSVAWIEASIVSVYLFISSIVTLAASITGFITNVFGAMFSTNAYAAIAFSIIMLSVSLTMFLRIWNILAGIEIFGWKIPKL